MPEPDGIRVLVVGINWPPETFLERLFDRLLVSGVELTVASARRPADSWMRRPGFRWLRAPSWNGPAPWRLLRLLRIAAEALVRDWRAVRRMKPHAAGSWSAWHRLLPFVGAGVWDVIYFPWNGAAIAHSPLYGTGSRVVVSCRGAQINVAPYNPKRVRHREGLGASLAAADAVHCVSDDMLRNAVAWGADPKNAVVIRPAVDPDVFTLPAHRDDGSPFRVITTGALLWRKGYEYALSAIRELVDGGVDVRYEIIGDGNDRQHVLYTIHDLRLEDRVILHGRLEPPQVVGRLHNAHVFLLSSLSEGISNAVIEAMSCGLPIVTTSCGGMGEAVTDGVEGYLVPVRDADAMAAALARLAEDPDLRRRMGMNGRRRVLAEFTLERQVTAFVELFRNVVRGHTVRQRSSSGIGTR
jgi:colanic acid/amylovoran biosynthesis glycosyltransferase